MSQPLYAWIGGPDAFRTAVELFYERVVADPLLAPFFENVNMTELQTHQVAFLLYVLGGPSNYRGRTLASVHAQLPIKQIHFDALTGHLRATLQALSVPPLILDEILSRVERYAPDVVQTGGQPQVGSAR